MTRRYRDGDETITAVNGFSAAFEPGEMVAVTGPSGSGKSTLLGLIGAIDYADEGTIHVGEVELGNLSTIEQDAMRAATIAYLYPDENLLPMLTVYENLSIALSLQRLPEPEIDARIRDSLKRLGVGPLAHRLPAALSSGQRALAAMARAIAAGAPVIVADEPTAHLDADHSAEVAHLLATSAKEGGRTIIVATHDPIVASCATRVIQLREGADTERHGAP